MLFPPKRRVGSYHSQAALAKKRSRGKCSILSNLILIPPPPPPPSQSIDMFIPPEYDTGAANTAAVCPFHCAGENTLSDPMSNLPLTPLADSTDL